MKKREERKSRPREQGAALLMTLLLISLLSLVSLAIGAVLTSNIKLTSAFRYREEAFWAAEAGIEKGLLFYRLNEEEPEFPDGTTADDNLYQRTILGEDGNDVIVDASDLPDRTQRVFDMRVYDRKKFDDQEFILKKDEGLTFRVTSIGNLNINSWDIIDQQGHTVDRRRSRLYHRINKKGTGGDTINWDTPTPQESRTFAIPFNNNTDRTIQLKAFIDHDQKKRMKIVISSGNDYIGGPYIYIESIGHYQGINKRLLVKIDREATSIYNILDYVIFSRSRLPSR